MQPDQLFTQYYIFILYKKTLNGFALIQALQLASLCIQAYQTCSSHTGCIEYQITIHSQWLFPALCSCMFPGENSYKRIQFRREDVVLCDGMR